MEEATKVTLKDTLGCSFLFYVLITSTQKMKLSQKSVSECHEGDTKEGF